MPGDSAYAAEPRIGGHGLLLRSWSADRAGDVEAWLRGVTDAEYMRWNTSTGSVTSFAEARASLARREDDRQSGLSVSYAITDETTGTILGHVAINGIVWDMRRAQVGFWVLPEARGRQVASRALVLASGRALDQLGLHRLELIHAVANRVSCRTAERCLYRYEGTLRHRMFAERNPSAFRDAHLHARIADDR